MPIDHLPTRWRPPLERLRGVMMSDAGVMIILGTIMLIRGVSYIDVGEEHLYHPADLVLPAVIPGVLWAATGGWLLLAAHWQATAFGRAALATGVAVLALWGGLFLFSPPAAFSQRGVLYIGLAAVVIWAVWRGKRGEIRVREERANGGNRTRR